ncbi:uncharacterized protein LOC134286689 [Aedes albopictus]|uniref:Integrase catalytic domain-containing protein n=1 Tax=Aedes albopictus TaxID=7160 RepID=A0ABM1ZMF4_AEDAL
MEQRFQKDPELKKLYVEFINEYKSLNHCEPIDESQDPPNLVKYYLPHHAVLKPSSSSTKLRVVFDASPKAKGPSLNDCLMIGPVVQNDLFSIILRFRKHRYVFSADISKMYRQIQVDRIHTPLLRIFWRENPTDPLQVLELTTVTYGTSAAPFLATRSLQQLAFDESTRYPFAAQIVLEDFYVDDALTGAETIEEAIQRRVELTEILNCGGFPIHKWCSNEPAILETVPEKDREQFLSFEDSDINQAIKTLGLLWDPAEDVYRFRLDLPSLGGCSPTKRNVLSQIAKIFDPLGLISPVVVFAKIIMQQIWMSKLKWDDVLDGKLLQAWIVFRDTLNHIHEIKIPRFFGAVNPVRYEIHGFADASSVAYGACLYIRVVAQDGVKVSLICSKSKVVAIKGLTIPRSELCAALLLVRLFLKVYPAVKMEFESVHFWSDSQIVLAWLRKPLPQLNLFVRNRVSEIVEGSSGADWNYIKSAENPADVVSRGQPPQLLVSNDLWWHGPQFLRSRTYRVDEPMLISDDELPEWSPVTNASAVSVPEPLPVMTAFGSFRKLQRVIAYVRRFVTNARSAKSQRITSRYLTVQEMRESMNVIVKYVQRSEFADEIGRLESKEPLRRLGNLGVMMRNDILRVGGRLRNASLPFGAKHQMLLPDKNPIVESLLRTLHRELLHIGPSGLIAYVRQKFWLLNARSVARKIVRSCVVCFRCSPQLLQPSMGDLPQARVVPAPPFFKSGVDFASPVFIRQGGRKSTLVKAYICLFVCMATKAIHLELVSDLSAAAFVAALHRFVARRGLVEELFSDNGSNFVGAKSELHSLYELFKSDQLQGKLNEFCQTREIRWTFIPPRAPNFGGLWEAGVKSTKTHLKKVLRDASLTFEEYYTVLTQIEAILNSRPLFSSSADPNEPEAITPGHFLIGRELTAIPEPNLEDTKLNRLSRWQLVQRIRDHFWRRWSREYLNTLQTRQKWTKGCKNVIPDTVVLLKEDNIPPQSWKLGRIVNVYPGSDSVVRVADVQTVNGVFRRPISKLAPLPIEQNPQ